MMYQLYCGYRWLFLCALVPFIVYYKINVVSLLFKKMLHRAPFLLEHIPLRYQGTKNLFATADALRRSMTAASAETFHLLKILLIASW